MLCPWLLSHTWLFPPQQHSRGFTWSVTVPVLGLLRCCRRGHGFCTHTLLHRGRLTAKTQPAATAPNTTSHQSSVQKQLQRCIYNL